MGGIRGTIEGCGLQHKIARPVSAKLCTSFCCLSARKKFQKSQEVKNAYKLACSCRCRITKLVHVLYWVRYILQFKNSVLNNSFRSVLTNLDRMAEPVITHFINSEYCLPGFTLAVNVGWCVDENALS